MAFHIHRKVLIISDPTYRALLHQVVEGHLHLYIAVAHFWCKAKLPHRLH
jgi:hypothetical protein